MFNYATRRLCFVPAVENEDFLLISHGFYFFVWRFTFKAIRLLSSFNGGERSFVALCKFFQRRTIKRSGRLELNFGHDSEAYEKIRERVLKEHAVTNAIDALKERWRMITFKYNDCVERNEQRIERKLRTLCIQRQFDLIIVVFLFVLICLPICYGLSCII
ncbi:uncharacterized protein LOC123526574 isoform X2 [Mercenaria mercenaria]|uniref:uncharacterized protein LOC123526574 isoform X2 n=1 Tax=Mercenaria mercenaria TaxID=6596 RepID=UPI00234E7AFB|nr:uncharacterized protein LOC123526574 isoform X2 [Mercenaria mercenaria]